MADEKKLLTKELKNISNTFFKLLGTDSLVSLFIDKIRSAAAELKEIDTLLTSISRTNDKLSSSDLKAIGDHAFEAAGKYGIKASDFLSNVEEASLAGYLDIEGIAELSAALQSAGNLTSDLANQYIAAADKAYHLGGSVEKLRTILDGCNSVTRHNALSMTELTAGISAVGETASVFGVDADQAAAALGTLISVTGQSGAETARAFQAILFNIRQIADADAGITFQNLLLYEKACSALNVSLKETRNGIQSLRNPMEVLEELSKAYEKLGEKDIRKKNLLDAVGSEAFAAQLDALLNHWDTYEKMLTEYENGTDSLTAAAQQQANSLEGSLNRLENTWNDTASDILNPEMLTGAVNILNTLLGGINKLSDSLGSLGTIGAIGAVGGISSFVKNFA